MVDSSQSGWVTAEPLDHPLAAGRPTGWASAWGQDSYGVWAAFSVAGVQYRMRFLPPGRFLMGSPEAEPGRFSREGPRREVTLTRGFWLGETTVTQELWAAGARGESGNSPETELSPEPSEFEGAERPVERVSWSDCSQWIDRVNRALPGSELRLPSEAEWEYGCRAGTSSAYSWGEEPRDDHAWFGHFEGNKDKKLRGTVAVRSYSPNGWGLFEMHGNVFEWCSDAWSADPSSGAAIDPARPGSEGSIRVIRGGSCYSHARLVRSAYRSRFGPGGRSDYLGFRLARGQG